ncbi:hypothetical protein SAMN02744778_01211 [Pantoea sp. GL120224-02]|nr:hypothetical protein SAMN02744778_01211 [Pantoea sp. GL120224-02]
MSNTKVPPIVTVVNMSGSDLRHARRVMQPTDNGGKVTLTPNMILKVKCCKAEEHKPINPLQRVGMLPWFT